MSQARPLRRCMLAPVPEIERAADLLRLSVDYHLSGDRARARDLIKAADLPEIGAWSDKLWGKRSEEIHRFATVADAPPTLPKEERHKPRMPGKALERQILRRDGFHCRFCGIPVISIQVRKALRKVYPQELRWGRSAAEQHYAFQAMWLAFDHVVPHHRGGSTSLENIVVACQPCNCGRSNYTLEEVSLLDPREFEPVRSDWCGLEQVLTEVPQATVS